MKGNIGFSLKLKLILIIFIIVIFSTIGTTALLTYNHYHNSLEQMKIDGLSMAKISAENIATVAKVTKDIDEVQKTVEAIAKSDGMDYTLIISSDYEGVCDSTISDIGKKYPNDPVAQTVIEKKISSSNFWTKESGEKVLDVQVPVDFKLDNKEIASVDVGISLSNLNKSLTASISTGIIISVILIIVFTVFPLIFINRHIIKNIMEGIKVSKAIADCNLAVDTSIKTKDEIGEIVNSILKAKNNLKGIITNIQQYAEKVHYASKNLLHCCHHYWNF